jgi:hypothetical protein
LLKGLKERFPNKGGEFFKQMIKDNFEDIQFTFSPKVYKSLKKIKNDPISKLTKVHLEIFKEFYPAYDIFQPDIDISILEIDPKGKKAIYRFRNSIFLEDNDDYIYHMHFMSGLTEGILEKETGRDIECNVENYHVAGEKEDSYVDVSIVIN